MKDAEHPATVEGVPVTLYVELNARLQPMHRHDLEDVLEAICAEQGWDVQVVGGGTAVDSETGEVRCCDIHLWLASEELVPDVLGLIEAVLAPVGSTWYVDDAEPQPFGRAEGLALYLNGTDLPIEVYEAANVDAVLDECSRLIQGVGRLYSYWSGRTETALYLYGASFDELKARIQPLLESCPLCERCRVVRIA